MSVSKNAGSQKVIDFLNNLEHPLKQEIEQVRSVILNADSQITEHIKWNAPSFCYRGEDRITFNLQGKGFFRLIFHCGAKVKDSSGKGPLFKDPTGLLDWVSGDRGIVKIKSRDEVEANREKLTRLVTLWIEAAESSET
ncbi:DUF1801 domain-containing protein [Fontibacillus sp. BL9]|uniref:DUF1801 domain-containing protein n=1 Tax=Fontibacillus sp. BL9 TaxID=3389971 RepID=UPI00397E5A56